jgi:predicted transposase YbfD/YdcC
MATLLEHFDNPPDPRVDRTKRLHLRDTLALTILAVIGGAESFVEVVEFGRAKEAWFRTFLELPHGIPSHDTLERVFARLDPKAFQERFMAWVGSIREQIGGDVISIDGKSARRSVDGARGLGPIHLVGAWAAGSRLKLGQVKTSERSNEITAIPEPLELLDLGGRIVTINTMGCQKAIAAKIVERGGDYVPALTDKHPTRAGPIEDFFEDGTNSYFAGMRPHFHEESTQEHDRSQVRRTRTSSDLECLPEFEEWVGMKSLIRVEARRQVLGKQGSLYRRYTISSPSSAPARQATRIVRSHWGIENRMHGVLHVGPHEDDARAHPDHSAENFATIRRFALNLFKQETSRKVGVKPKSMRAGRDNEYLLKVIAG